jgi:hypothetical protein
MKQYNCNLCNFSTLNLPNYKRHVESQKHVKNQQDEKMRNKKQFICPNCEGEFAFSSGLSKHKKTCKVENNKYNPKDILIVDLQNRIHQLEIEKLNVELKAKDDKIKAKDNIIKIDKKFYNEIIKQKDTENKRMENIVKQSGSITKTTTKALAYLASNYPDAPTLNSFPKIDHDKIRGEFNSIPEMICYTENHNTTTQHLSKIITEHLLLEDKSKRPLWTADSSRIKFVVCTIIENIKEWIYDENGIVFGKEVLDSIIDKIRAELQQYIQEAPKKMRGADVKDMELITQIQKAANNTVIKIDDGLIKSSVIRAVAPEFSIKTNQKI